MDWIKRNLYFLIGGLVALALMGAAGFFLYSRWASNNEEMSKLNQDYEELKRLNGEKPHPGVGQINNIRLAKEQREEVKVLIKRARGAFEPIPPIPNLTNVTDRDFSGALSRTIDTLQKTATNSSVVLPPNYLFSFTAQNAKVSFAAGSPPRLAIQLGEIKTICDLLYSARINALDNIRRERVSTDDQNSGTLTDYFDKKSVTNNLAVISPYEVTFRCFTPELAGVLSVFASSPHGILARAINVDLAPAPPPSEEPTPMTPVAPIYVPTTPGGESRSSGEASAAFQRRYGIGPGGRGPRPGMPPPQPVPQQPIYQPMAQPANRGGLQTVLNEKQLKVTLLLYVVKLRSEDEVAAAPREKPQPPSADGQTSAQTENPTPAPTEAGK